MAAFCSSFIGYARDDDGIFQKRISPRGVFAIEYSPVRGSSAPRTAAMVSAAFPPVAAMARHFGWNRVFDGVFAGDMSSPKVRKPELLARVMRGFGARADECAFVGDTANDFEAARENGVFSVGVGWGYGRPDELALADVVCGALPFPL